VRLTLVALLLFGCATVEIREGDQVVAKASAFGRACIALERDEAGRVSSVIVDQAATSDWSLARSLSWIAEVAGGVFGGERRATEPGRPSSSAGCGGVLE